MTLITKIIMAFTLIGLPYSLLPQNVEVEPNNTREGSNSLSLGDVAKIGGAFSPAGDVDFFNMEWQTDHMYYLTSIENDEGIAPNLELYFDAAPNNILTSNVGGRNGNNNFRLSGYVPDYSGTFYAKIYDQTNASGSYKIRLAGGRGPQELMTHEPDGSIAFASGSEVIAKDDTIYGALYPENDIDYYKISAEAGERFEIMTLPILDLDVRDTDTYIMLFDSFGNLITENDDVGTVQTPSGAVNSTFSRMIGAFPAAGTYYIAVRSYYNSNYDQEMNEANPAMGEYGLYYISEMPDTSFARYPIIELPTTQSVHIQWRTTTLQPTHLKWGTDTDCDYQIINEELGLDHQVQLSGLEANHQYFYRVFSSDKDSTETEYFYTAKPTSVNNTKFFVISDSSPYEGFGSTPAQLEVAAQIQNVEYDFGLHAGDVNQHHGEEYDLVFFEPYKDILANAPIFPCVGNHDTYYDNTLTYQNAFNLPYNNPDSTERYYSFNYGFAHFISLDTNLPYYPGSTQYTWLEEDLQSEMRRETSWTFVYFHHPPWSEGWPGYPGEEDVRDHLVPLFEQYGVDMVFSGHTHDYERGRLNGVYYIITGGGGAPLESGEHAYDYDHVDVWVNQHSFTYIELDDKTLTLRAINIDGNSIDSFSYDKQFTAIDHSSKQTGVIPDKFGLDQNYPNPFNPVTTINYELQITNYVELNIYNLLGEKVVSLVSEVQEAGQHQVQWDASDMTSGVYYYQIRTGDFVDVKKMILLR